MDKSAIIEFSNKARDKLNAEVRSQATRYGISSKEIRAVEEHDDSVVINGKVFNSKIKNQRFQLVKQIRNKGYEQVMEEVTYTWFNRLVALKFMEMNGCLPDQIRVFTSANPNKPEPDLLTNALKLDFLDLDRNSVLDLKAENKGEELYKDLILKLCNYLHKIMPFLFEEIEDYTELLFPDKLLHTGSVLHDLNSIIPDEDWHEVEIIGWIYQDYIAPKKDKVFADLKKNIKINKENIPAATQLFTPKWIVKYLVENSLGRLWLESNPNPILQSKFKYFIEQDTLDPEKPIYYPEEIKVLDPAMGSGHILIYAFEVLSEIYHSIGYSDSEIAPLILNRNLYGFDIDNRAAQLAGFAVMMKARKYDKNLFSKKIELNLYSIQETNNIDYLDKNKYPEMVKAFDCFLNAKEYGSILNLPEFDWKKIEKEYSNFEREPTLESFVNLENPLQIIKQAKLMKDKYHCVITNPPYMGIRNINSVLSKYVQKEYPDSKSDLFAAFIEKCLGFTKPDGYSSMVTQQTWMFISSYENLRDKILSNYCILNLIQIGFNSFPELNSKLSLACAFIIKNKKDNFFEGSYLNLNDASKTADKEKIFFAKVQKGEIFKANSESFRIIIGCPIAYWVSNKVREIFRNNPKIEDISRPRQGMSTSDNDRFLRIWSEVNYNKINFNCRNRKDAMFSKSKWFPYNKGGEFKKWYGNNDFVVNWENDGEELREWADWLNKNKTPAGRLKNKEFYFRKSITWSLVSWVFGVRASFEGFIFDVGGSSLFVDETDYYYLLSFLCSKIASKFLDMVNPSLNYPVGDVGSLPIIFTSSKDTRYQVDQLAQKCISISREEWDSHETSWDFKISELLRYKITSLLEDAYNNYCVYWKDKFLNLHGNEEELNRIFINIYDLKDEITSEVPFEEITVLKNETWIEDGKLIFKKEEIIKQFISYAVGCMFGRYSPEKEGLILANQGEKLADFKEKVPEASFLPDEDNIIPVLDDEYYADDIVGRFKEFLKFTFGAETLSENLDFIAGVLSKKGEAPEKVIRNYFLKDFYSDHVKMYKKRPIYWLFTSGKDKVFNALVYMHRYDKTTLAKMRIDYLLDFESKMDSKRLLLEKEIIENSKNKGKAETELAKLKKKIEELVKYDELLKNKADQMIEIDLDDGVVKNYKKFEGLVAKI